MRMLLTLPLALMLAGCSSEAPEPAEPAAQGETHDESHHGHDHDHDHSHDEQNPADADEPSPAPGATDLGGASIVAPAHWVVEVPSSNMRSAQFAVDGASCVIFNFPGGAGPVEANIDRWCGQFVQPDGSPSRQHADIGTTTVNDYPVTTIYLTGRYIAETTPGSGQRLDHEGWALAGAIIQAGANAYYVKFTGPEDVINANRDAFDAMIASIAPTSG